MHYRTGSGFDVHAFDDNKANSNVIRLCGVDIPHHRPLKGHSDADVALHALTDAIYGICANGDIGYHFPPSKAENKGRDSQEFLDHALGLLKQSGGALTHIDITIMGEEPKINPSRDAIIQHLSKVIPLPANAIGLKATTTEKLGFTGRKEGLACQATATAYFENGFIDTK